MNKFYALPIEGAAALTALFVRPGGGENAIIGNVLTVFGVPCGLLLSLIAVASCQSLSEVDSHASAEASAHLALDRDAVEFPSPQKSELQGLLKEYCRCIIQVDWPVERKSSIPLGPPYSKSLDCGLEFGVSPNAFGLVQQAMHRPTDSTLENSAGEGKVSNG